MTKYEMLAFLWILLTWLAFLYAGYYLGYSKGYRRGFRDGRNSEDPM